MQQHYSRLAAKSSNEIKTTQNIIRRETRKVYSVEWVPTLLVNDEKFKDPTDVANAFNKFFIIVTEKLNIQQTEKGKAISILKHSFPGNFPNQITEDEIKSITHSLKQKKKIIRLR